MAFIGLGMLDIMPQGRFSHLLFPEEQEQQLPNTQLVPSSM